MALRNASRSALYAVGGSCVMITLESITAPPANTTGGTFSRRPPTSMPLRRTRYSVGMMLGLRTSGVLANLPAPPPSAGPPSERKPEELGSGTQ
ncbi:Os06g0122001 [Oryza sativa Japonica Group]|uniref:Os06g0122001 protein n=1 Tax=Oryza sativa subsp. japonica TaxID=39947 RepID=C7J404_ORYSJ|nr:Os06g0122001 [Oryza sativa Japonica Group]|eukprot:NP_001174575.1 Os06g0122001 [Oryza sativa Japonica Group]